MNIKKIKHFFEKHLIFLLRILVSLFFGLILTPIETKADTVHLGLKINYKTAMSHVEKRDLAVIEMLERIATLLPEAKFLISGHTDIVGNYDINIELSKGRANTVKLLLEQRKVSGDRIYTKWFSYDAPIGSNTTEEGRAQIWIRYSELLEMPIQTLIFGIRPV